MWYQSIFFVFRVQFIVPFLPFQLGSFSLSIEVKAKLRWRKLKLTSASCICVFFPNFGNWSAAFLPAPMVPYSVEKEGCFYASPYILVWVLSKVLVFVIGSSRLPHLFGMCSFTMVLKERDVQLHDSAYQKLKSPKQDDFTSFQSFEFVIGKDTYLPTPVNSLSDLSSFQFPTNMPWVYPVNLL